jgi:flagellar motor switch protein FliM
MVAPLVDGILHRMSQHLVGHPDAYWACGFRYGAMIDDRRSLGMALAAPDFHVFQLPLDIAEGTRSGAVILALPQRAAPVVPADKRESAQVSVPLQQRVLDAPVRLDAILCRLSLPLSDVGRLAVGDVLALPKDVLRDIAIETVGRQPVATARLGQVDGMRALRLTSPGQRAAPNPVKASADPGPPPPTAPPPPVPTPTLDQWNEDAGDPMSYGLDDGHAAA